MSIITIVALLVFLTIPEGSSLGDQTLLLRCQCITKEKKPIGRYIGQVEVIPASSHCNEIEIIATLKKDGRRICLDPNARWVRRVLKKKMVQPAP
ncbi:interleukin-8-like precursor [Larimichthys crocea]|uniref:Interleukin 8 n=1 Tax=Larimichthys crocea TaxID=215358 RepID=L7PIB6_LARCR|nr:interleukin-8-like precursor [Larimichthys crocea]AFV77975.1 interleukin 8 [Larimichthys crocea]AFV77976.1 interleukin 8 [Larimichthys crocea]